MRGRVWTDEPYVDNERRMVGITLTACIGEDSLIRGPYHFSKSYTEAQWITVNKAREISKIVKELTDMIVQTSAKEVIEFLTDEPIIT